MDTVIVTALMPFDLILELLFFLSVLNTPLFSANPAPSTSSIVIDTTYILLVFYYYIPQVGGHDAALPGTCTQAFVMAHAQVMSHLVRQGGTYSYSSCIMVLRDMTEHMYNKTLDMGQFLFFFNEK